MAAILRHYSQAENISRGWLILLGCVA